MSRDEIEQDFLEINLYALDKEWVGQPNLVGKVADALADARGDLRDAETDFKVFQAKMMLRIRNDPEKYGLDKITEAAVKETMTCHDKIVAKQKEINAMQHKVDLLQGAMTALDHRKRALENLVDLHGREYFASPTAKAETRERMKMVEKRMIRSKGRR